MMRYLLTFWCLLLSTFAAFSSISDTLIALEPVVAKGVKFNRQIVGAKMISLDTFQLAVNPLTPLSEILSYQSITTVTSYGPGGQAGIKMRGGSTDHTTVIWNGLNIKPPMSGELNYSTITSGIINDIKIQPGGSSTMYGSGASTGVVYLSNNMNMSDKGFKASVGSEAGSYEYYGLNGIVQYIGKKYGSRLALVYTDAENNFKYKAGKKIKQEEHAAYNNLSLVQQNVLLINPSTRIETDLWYSNHFKQIPSLISDSEPGKTEQTDDNIRLAVNLNHTGKKYYVKYRGGFLDYLNDFLGYDITELEYYTALNRSRTIINEIETKYQLSSLQAIYLGANYTYDKVTTENYTNEGADRNQVDFFGRYGLNLFQNQLRINIEGRQSITDGTAQPFIYSTGADFNFFNDFTLKALFANLYTLPDLNDLYWTKTAYASGNSDLKPESGYSLEMGLLHKKDLGITHFSHELTYYYTVLNDAIVWVESSSLWVPVNYNQSENYGLEFIGSTGFQFPELRLNIGYDYCYTHAMVKTESSGEISSTQRTYIPKHKAGLKIQGSFDNYFAIGVYGQYVGERIIDEVSLPLDDYFLVDFYTNYQLKLFNKPFTIYGKIKNVLNTSYRILSGYAQPLRTIYLGINYKL